MPGQGRKKRSPEEIKKDSEIKRNQYAQTHLDLYLNEETDLAKKDALGRLRATIINPDYPIIPLGKLLKRIHEIKLGHI
jgi:hypothetical protein